MPIRRIAVALVLLASLGLVACGGSDLASDPQAVLAGAKLPPEGPNASKLSLEVTPGGGAGGASTTDSGGATTPDAGGIAGLLGGPIQIEASTEGDAATGVTGDAKVTAGPANLAIAFRANADDAWVQVGEEWYALGQPLGIDFGGLSGAVGDLSKRVRDPKAVAVEDVDGVECDRITGTLDPGADLTDALNSAIQNLPFSLDPQSLGQAEVSVWVSRDDDVIRRVQIDTGEDSDTRIQADLTVVPAEAVTVTPPASAKPITDLLVTLLGDQLGDLGGMLGNGLDLGALLGSGQSA